MGKQEDNICYVGIDPGKSGAIAWECGGDRYAAKMPETARGLFLLLRDTYPGVPKFVTLEQQWARPGMDKVQEATEFSPAKGKGQFRGSLSNAKLMQNYGVIQGVLGSLDIEPLEVAPLRWQNRLGCRTRGDKKVTWKFAKTLFPEVKIYHWNADAYLLAHYGRTHGIRD